MYGFETDMVAAFARFMHRSVTSDSGCKAKVDLLNCLLHLDHSNWETYLTAVTHVQLEKVFAVPPVEDTAVNLRATAAMGLANSGYPDVYPVLSKLLCDKEAISRRAAAQTLAHMGGERAWLALSVRLLSGESNADVRYDRHLKTVAKAFDWQDQKSPDP